jgi:hypothetical protein
MAGPQTAVAVADNPPFVRVEQLAALDQRAIEVGETGCQRTVSPFP